MKSTVRVKQTRVHRFVGFVVATALGVFGYMLLPAEIDYFGILWLSVAAFIAVYNLVGLISSKGVTDHILEIEGLSHVNGQGSQSESVEERIKKLDMLKRNGSITLKEYDEQRKRILESI